MPGRSDDPAAAQRSRTLADRLAASQRLRFVGRDAERSLFTSVLSEIGFPVALLHVHGPGGVGKSTLLREYLRIAAAHGVRTVLLDGRDLTPSPDDFVHALRAALGVSEAPISALSAQRSVLLIDTFERLTPLDGWLREVFLPQLSDEVFVVLAGRQPLSSPWRLDPGWRDLTTSVGLRNFRPEESRTLLTRRGIPEERQRRALAYTHGHPLALALVADVLDARAGDERPVRLGDDPDIVRTLLERFLDQVPSPDHRAALEVCALARTTTEALLAEALGDGAPGDSAVDERAADCFAWLRERSFIDSGPRGLVPHDLVRDALDADLRWRNPDRHHELHRRVRGFITRRMLEARGREQQQLLVDDVYLHRHNPMVAPFIEWGAAGTVFAERAREADHPALVAMVARHEGGEAAALAERWLEHRPEGWRVFRQGGGDPAGLLATVRLDLADDDLLAADPAAVAALDYARRRAPPRPGEAVQLFRFWMAADAYQGVSPVQTAIFLHVVQSYFAQVNPSWSFFPCADPEFWLPALHYMDVTRRPEADFELAGRRWAMFAHDWRELPVPAWLELLGERELATDLTPEALATARPAPLIVLSEPEFRSAVKEAFKHHTRPAELARNPLLRSRLLTGPDGDPADPERLRALLVEATDALRANPRDEKLYRALLRTYLEPAATQELAAEALGLPFSTYRRHLGAGLERVAEQLWQRELEGGAEA